MKLLGIGGFFHDLNFTYHDTAQNITISAEEERFSRIKMHSVLNKSNTSTKAVDWMNKNKGFDNSQIEIVIFSDLKEYKITEYLRSLFLNADFVHFPHHKSHAYNVTALNSIKTNADVYCFDAYGDGYSGCKGKFNPSIGVEVENYFQELDSLGLLYTSATAHLGLGSFGSEGKMQGLASYGNYEEELSIAKFLSSNQFGPKVDSSLRKKTGWQEQEQYAEAALSNNEFFSELIERRFSDEPLEKKHSNFAATIQADIFNVILGTIKSTITNDSIIISGGLAQNSTLIHFLKEELNCNIFTSTSCSDRGNSLGAVQGYLYEHNKSKSLFVTPFLGFDADEEDPNLSQLSIISNYPDGLTKAASLLADGEIICSFLGSAELGARALGNRSILSSPVDPSRRDFLNRSIKHREGFRPFAPIIKQDISELAFKQKELSLYMTECLPASSWFRKEYPSAIHIDGSARVQVVSKGNPAHPVISKLLDLTASNHNLKCLLNTSFNDAGEPIVNSLRDAINTMQRCSIKYIITSKGLYKLN